MKKYKSLFRIPLKSDWAFKLWIGLSATTVLVRFFSNLSNNKIGISGTAGLISGLIDAVFSIIFALTGWYLISLIWLLPRRFYRHALADSLPQEYAAHNTYASTNIDGIPDEHSEKYNSQRKKIGSTLRVPLVLVAATTFLFFLDQGLRNHELSALISQIEVSERDMHEVVDAHTTTWNRYGDNQTKQWSNFDQAESDYSSTAMKYAPRLKRTNSSIEHMFILPWHRSISAARGDYLKHSDSWIQSLNFESNGHDQMLWSDPLNQEVFNTWEAVTETLTNSVPVIDFGGYSARIRTILED